MHLFNRKIIKESLLVLASIFLFSCGSGSEEKEPNQAQPETVNLLQGVFIDSPVEGLQYRTHTQNGVTNLEGKFFYLEGESIEFYYNDIYFGTANGAPTITPIDLTSQESTINEHTIAVLRVLQSADEDGDPTNGIKLAPDDSRLTGMGSLNLPTDDIDVDLLLKNAGFVEESIVSAQQALAHFQQSAIEALEPVKTAIDTLRSDLQKSETERVVVTGDDMPSIYQQYHAQAFLSEDVYSVTPSLSYVERGGWRPIVVEVGANGIKAALYQNAYTGLFNIVFGGTGASLDEFSDLRQRIDVFMDVLTDLTLLGNHFLSPDQASSAIEFLSHTRVEQVLNEGLVSHVTGHSLGGALAQYVGLYTGIETVAFNSAPMPFNHDSIDLFLNQYNNETGRYALQIGELTDSGEVKNYIFTNEDKITNVFAIADPVSFISLFLMDLEEIAENRPVIDTFVLTPLKYNLRLDKNLQMDFLLSGNHIYLPIDTENAVTDHGISTLESFLRSYATLESPEIELIERVEYGEHTEYFFNMVNYQQFVPLLQDYGDGPCHINYIEDSKCLFFSYFADGERIYGYSFPSAELFTRFSLYKLGSEPYKKFKISLYDYATDTYYESNEVELD